MEDIDYRHFAGNINEMSSFLWNNAMLLQRCITFHMAGEPQELIDKLQSDIEKMKVAAEALDTTVDALKAFDALKEG